MLKEYIEKQLTHTREELNELQMKQDRLLVELKEIKQKEQAQQEERDIENEIFSPRSIRKQNGEKTAEIQKKIQTIEEEIERVQGLLHQSEIREKEYLNILEEIGTRETSNQTEEKTDENIREQTGEETDKNIRRQLDGQRVEEIEAIVLPQEKHSKEEEKVKGIEYSKKQEQKKEAGDNKDTTRFEKIRRKELEIEESETSIAVEKEKARAEKPEVEETKAEIERTEIETIETKELGIEEKTEKSKGKGDEGEDDNKRIKAYGNLNQNGNKKENTNENTNGDENNGKILNEEFFGKTKKIYEKSPKPEMDAETLDLRKTLMNGLENNILRQVKEEVIHLNEDADANSQSFLNCNEEIKSEEVIILEREREKEVEFLAKVYKKLEISLALLNDRNKCKNELREAKRMIQNYVKSLG